MPGMRIENAEVNNSAKLGTALVIIIALCACGEGGGSGAGASMFDTGLGFIFSVNVVAPAADGS